MPVPDTRSTDVKPRPALTAREVYQVLKDVALGVRSMTRACEQTGYEPASGKVQVAVEGWHITLYCLAGELEACEACTSPDGRQGSAALWQRFGTDPVHLLSRWEHEQLERLLHALWPA